MPMKIKLELIRFLKLGNEIELLIYVYNKVHKTQTKHVIVGGFRTKIEFWNFFFFLNFF